MSFIALKRMKVGDGHREYGEPIPEAADWKPMILAAYQASGFVRTALPDEYKAAKKKLADRLALEAKRAKEALTATHGDASETGDSNE